MNNNYNFNINPDKLSKKQIERHQDFDALLKQYQADPVNQPRVAKYRWLKLIGSTAAAACIGLAIYMSLVKPVESPISTEAYFASQKFINPPFENISAPFANYRVDANQGGVYNYENGSQLIVPPAAFVSQTGEIVSGEVDIKYREFHDFVDFFLSGIPMEYDSAGLKYHLESAGMIEIYAEQNGQRLNMSPGKSIDVVLISQINAPRVNVPPSYNIYKLDTKQRNWVYKGVDNIAFLASNELKTEESSALTEAQTKLELELKKLQDTYESERYQIEASIPLPIKPIKPMRANGRDHAFNLDFDVNSIGSVNPGDHNAEKEIEKNHLRKLKEKYGNIYWQVAANSPAIDESTKKTLWEDAQIKAINETDYELTLIQGSRRVKVIVNPVLMKNDFNKAMASYETAYAKYEQSMKEREAALAGRRIALEEKIESQKVALQKAFELQIAVKKENNADAKAQLVSQKVVNKFKANSFGIWNCDRPVLPASTQLKGSVIDDTQQKHQDHVAFLADKNKNTIARFYVNKDCQINYNQDSDNLLWFVTPEKKIAVFRPEKFKRINQSKDDFNFSVKVIEKKINSEKDVRDILKFEL